MANLWNGRRFQTTNNFAFFSAVGAASLKKPIAKNFKLRQEVLACGHHATLDGFIHLRASFCSYAAPAALLIQARSGACLFVQQHHRPVIVGG